MRFIISILLLIICLSSNSQTLYESNTGSMTGTFFNTYSFDYIYNPVCFGPDRGYEAYQVDSIGIRLQRVGTVGTISIVLCEGEVDSPYDPTETLISSALYDGSEITTSSSGEIVYIEFGFADEEIFLQSTGVYYIRIGYAASTSSNYVAWGNGGNYYGFAGAFTRTYDGSTFTSYASTLVFEVWGKPIGLLFIDNKYGSGGRVRGYDNKYNSGDQIYFYDNKY